ncbi:MAG: hypothetical protein HQL77_13565 [Magnetococcales bacterium]|nr:hypothetical protein [Magnetococcales bacterium]
MKSEWLHKSSLTFRESAWILLNVDPDDVGPGNQKKPTDPLTPGGTPVSIIQHFNAYLQWLDTMFRDVALGILPMTREPWNRFPLCFVRIGHLASWAEIACPEALAVWSRHGVVKEPLPPPPREWLGPEDENPALARIRKHMIQRAAHRQLHPMMKDEMLLLSQWQETWEDPATPVPLNDMKNALRPLYKELRNLPTLET